MIAYPRQKTVSPLGHSADIAMHLHANGSTFPLVQTRPTAVMLEERSTGVPQGPAQVEMIIDGVSYLNNVVILGPDADGVWLNIALKPVS